MHEVACPGCGNQSRLIGEIQGSHWFAGARLDESMPGGCLYACRHCFLKFRHPVLDADSYQHLYDNSLTTAWAANVSRPDWDRMARYLHHTLPQGGRILDFGCNRGELLHRIEGNYEKHGVEINRSAAEIAATLSHVHIWHTLEEMPDDLRFDAIITSDVIEHVPNPEALAERLLQLLSKDGALIISTGDADNSMWNLFGPNWWYCFIPEHISFISARWLAYFSGKHRAKILCLEKFRYVRLGTFKYMLDWVLTAFYGVAPRAYLKSGALVKRLLGRSGEFAPRGVGISADHVFVVLARLENTQVGPGMMNPIRNR